MNSPALPDAFRYLPLVPRPRPAPLPLPQRLAELRSLLGQAAHAPAPERGMTLACEVMNKAALVASDIGRSDLAETLCRQQYETFRQALPLATKAAVLALQPLVNLARLDIRTGDPVQAYAVLESLFTAADQNGSARLLGRACPVGPLVTSAGDRAELRRFLWAVLLADGTRALCAAGRWQKAVDHLHRYNGIGTRLLDGRQVAAAAALHRGDTDTARELSTPTPEWDPWERAVAACLSVARARMHTRSPASEVSAMAHAVLTLAPVPGCEVFTARLGVLACELAPDSRELADHLTSHVLAVHDTRTVTALVDSPIAETVLTPQQQERLHERLSLARTASMHTTDLLADLTEIYYEATTHLSRNLEQARLSCSSS